MKVFVGIPSHDGRIESTAFKSVESERHQLILMVNESSLLAYNCNQLLSQALNLAEKHDVKWFAMLHSDVAPEMYWIDRLIDQAESHKADLLSAVVPIKTDEQLSSTAWSEPLAMAPMHFDAHRGAKPYVLNTVDLSSLPGVFGGRDFRDKHGFLLANTGCMIYNLNFALTLDIDKTPCFKTEDWIEENPDGTVSAHVFPEDWNFSRQVALAGGNVMVTSTIELNHVGKKRYHL